jgi:hypothetical protein
MVSVDYNDKETLDLLEKYSIGAVVNGVFPSWWGSDGEKSGRMSEFNPLEKYQKCVETYTPHNAIWGIDIGDEISCKDFNYVNTIFETQKDFFKDKIMYMNLYPNYGVRVSSSEEERKKQWGCQTYKEYIENYCKKISLPYICFDHYPYCHNDLSMFIENLECVKQMSDKYKKQVYLVAQSSSYDKDTFLNQSELRTQLYIALAFNVKVFMWACWSAGWWHNHAVDESGNTTKLYADIVKVNREIKNFFKKYSDYKCGKVRILNSYIMCEMENLQTGKKDAIYVVNTGSSNKSEYSFKCKLKPKVYSMDKKCRVMYDKRSCKCALYLTSGYGAIIKTIIT